jgi:hypothetical protein
VPYTVIQAGDDLQLISQTGEAITLLMPSGITLRTDVPPRWEVYGGYAILVNTPSRPLTIDALGTVRPLVPLSPRLSPVLSGVTSGALSGTYTGRYTFVILDLAGNIIAESDYSPISNEVTIASKMLRYSSLDISPDTISARRLYRTTTNGAVYFQWFDLDGNVLTFAEDDLSDEGLSLLANPVLGSPPYLTHIAQFRGRLFGVGDTNKDYVRYTEAGVQYAWPADNIILIPPQGADAFGVTALVGRREALGVGRRNQLAQITGSGVEEDGDTDFDLVILSKELGIFSQESVAVYRDTAYFLWYDGVYSWNSEGINCISDGSVDGRGNVRSWFTTDSYFNRSRFSHAFGHVDPIRDKYRLFLASPDSDVENRWVEFDLKERTWWGPHKTGLFTPTSVLSVTNSSDIIIPVIGSSAASIYREQITRTDGPSTAIDMDVIGKRHDMKEPDPEKYWGMISMIGKAQAAGRLIVQSIVGDLNATRTKIQYYDMTKTRESLGRCGHGKHMELRFRHSTAGEPVELYAYEIDDVHLIGRR